MQSKCHRPARTAVVLLLGIGLTGAACAGDDSSAPSTSTSVLEQPPESSAPETTETPETTEQPVPTTAPGDPLDRLRAAVFRIETVGTVVEPDQSLSDPVETLSWGGGTGFVIDSSGLAVTNQHVVGGAATIEAYLDGSEEPVSARLIGSSECSDLAVIDLEGDGYTALDWYDGEVEPGLEIFVAGYPLGDPEYTLLDGIVSKARADGETSWASVDWVIEHTAPTQPGNSGGPVVTPDGEVVAVNYAYGRPGTGTSQHFAIAREVAVPLIDQLTDGERSIGVSGQAIVDEATGASGMWVSAVDSGSPADSAGVQPGDMIERLEGLPVGFDGTLETYCDVLDSHASDDVMSLQVLRFAEDVRLRGSLNGTPLAPVESLGQTVDEVVDVDESATTYEDYVLITDDSGSIEVEVPTEWTQVDGYVPFTSDSGVESGVGLRAAPELEAFLASWTVPGVTFSATTPYEGETVEDLLALNVELFTYLESCTARTVEDYDDGLYTGVSQLFTDCGGTSTSNMLISAENGDDDVILFLTVQIVTDADLDALDQIIATFRAVGPVDGGSSDESELAPEEYAGYQDVFDQSGALAVEVPVEWTDIRSQPGFRRTGEAGEEDVFHGVGLVVSTDIDAWFESWGVPGLSMSATSDFDGDIDAWFYEDYTQVNTGGWFYRTDCEEAGVYEYEDPLYSGLIGYYTDCGGGDTELTVIVAAPPDDAFLVVLAITSVTDADDEAYVRVLDTFQVVAEIPD